MQRGITSSTQFQAELPLPTKTSRQLQRNKMSNSSLEISYWFGLDMSNGMTKLLMKTVYEAHLTTNTLALKVARNALNGCGSTTLQRLQLIVRPSRQFPRKILIIVR